MEWHETQGFTLVKRKILSTDGDLVALSVDERFNNPTEADPNHTRYLLDL